MTNRNQGVQKISDLWILRILFFKTLYNNGLQYDLLDKPKLPKHDSLSSVSL